MATEVSQLAVETVTQPSPASVVSQVAVETVVLPPHTTSIVSSLVVETICVANGGGETISVPALSGSGTVVAAPPITGTGNITIGPPGLHSGVLHLTQEVRDVPWDESAPSARLTQFGRDVPWKETGTLPNLRLTQMARQVLYTYQCSTETPPLPLDIPVVHVLKASLTPRWKLERFDQKIRTEDGVNIFPILDATPTWKDDGKRWLLARLDIELGPQEQAETGDSTTTENAHQTPAGPQKQWFLERFDLSVNKQEIS